jgi:hypothetical protein
VTVSDPHARALIGLLDGTRDRPALRADLVTAGGPALPPALLDRNLAALAGLGLLEA